MSDFTDEEWNYAGALLAGTYFAGPMLAGALLAVQCFMVLYGQTVFSSTPKPERQGRLLFILASWAILITYTIDFVLSAWDMYLKLYLGGPTGKSYAFSPELSKPYDRRDIVGDAFLCTTIALGDILMLWRCFELWREKKWVLIPPFLACLGSLVALCISLAPFGYNNATYTRVRMIIAAACMSVALNIMITSLILFRLIGVWLVRRKAALKGQKMIMYSNVAAILIESAAPLAFCGIIFITTTAVWLYGPPKDLGQQARLVFIKDIFDWLYYSFCALSPQMIIFRVTLGSSWRNARERSEEEVVFSQPIRFSESHAVSLTRSLKDSA